MRNWISVLALFFCISTAYAQAPEVSSDEPQEIVSSDDTHSAAGGEQQRQCNCGKKKA